MPSFQLSISPSKRAAGRFIARVRRELQKAFSEEKRDRSLTQAEVARELGVHRSVINRQMLGVENLTLSRVAELAQIFGREIEFRLVREPSAPGSNIDAMAEGPTGTVATVPRSWRKPDPASAKEAAVWQL